MTGCLRCAMQPSWRSWSGWAGSFALGAIAAPAMFDVVAARQVPDGRLLSGAIFGEILRRFHHVSYICGIAIVLSLAARALLGPRPRRFAVRMSLVAGHARRGSVFGVDSVSAHRAPPTERRRCTFEPAAGRPAPRRVRTTARSLGQRADGADARRARAALLRKQGLMGSRSGLRRHAGARCRRRSTKQATANPRPQRPCTLLKQQMPDYTWVGIYLLDGNELVLGPVRRQAVTAHAHSARARHLRRRRHRENHDHRRRRECGFAISGVQHRDAVGDRRADHAGHRGARRDRHRQRPPRSIRCRRTRRCSRPLPPDWPRASRLRKPRTLEPWNLRTPNL